MYRTRAGRQRWYTIGKLSSPWTVETARDEARRLLGDVHYGDDPAADKQANRRAETIAQLCDRYVSDAENGRLIGRQGEPKKLSTVSGDKIRIAAHIKPLLGSRTVASITRRDVEQFMHSVAAGKTAKGRVLGGRAAATRTVGLLGGIMSYAAAHELIETSPVRGVRRFADGRRERRLSDGEYAKLSESLKAVEGSMPPPVVACLEFLALTGWRSGEARALRWRHVVLERRIAILPDTKSGRSVRPLSHAACALLRRIAPGHDDALVFPSSRGDRLFDIRMRARRIFALAGLTGVSCHTLRHSFASVAVDLGLSELTIASLLGHRKASVTSKYAHNADATLLQAADQVAGRITALMGDAQPAGTVVELRPHHRS
jgi:integrase